MNNYSLNKVLKSLDLDQSVVFRDKNDNSYDAQFHKDIQQKIESILPDAVYIFNSQPLILFFDLTEEDRELNDLYKKVWSFDNTSIIFIIKNTDIEVFNALNYIKDKKQNTLEKIDISTEEIERLFNLWELESGNTWNWFQKEYIEKQKGKTHRKRVNERLFSNIKDVRNHLTSNNSLDENEANSLILRLIFIRYLIDRKIKIDDELIPGDVENLNDRRKNFIQLIKDPEKLNQLFIKLNERFNGILFKENEFTLTENQAEYLSGVFAGELDGDDSLFKEFFFEIFDFSIIPVEVISGIYESLIDEEKRKLDSAVYTPSFLVDYILKDTVDEFLKDNKPEDCTIFEVAVGSGIFLVQSLRRIIEKEIEINGNEDKNLFSEKIKSFAENNLYGIDINQQALKVTCFSIYIALLDYLDPADINIYQFPKLIGNNLFNSNFFGKLNDIDTLEPADFEEVIKNIKPKFILGNPPWKKDKSKEHLSWVNSTKTYNKKIKGELEIAQSFLLRTKEFMQEDTVCSLIVTSTIFYNISNTTKEFKADFLKSYNLNKFFDLSPVRRLIFERKISPATVINFTLSKNKSYNSNIVKHQSVKSNIFLKNFKILVIEKFDQKEILQKHFIENDWMFKVALYGNTLDFHFLKRIADNTTLEQNFGNNLISLDGFKRDKLQKFGLGNIDEYITEKESINNFYTPSKKTLVDNQKLSQVYSNFGKFRIILKGQTKNESEIVTSFSDSNAIFRNDTFLLVSNQEIIKNIFTYLISDLYTYFQYITSSTWGIATRPAIRLQEYINFPFIECDDNQKQKNIKLINEFLEPINQFYETQSNRENEEEFKLKPVDFKNLEISPINQNILNQINVIINSIYKIKDHEKDLIDYVLNVSRYQFQESKQDLFTYKVDDNIELLKKYAEVYLDEFSKIYIDEHIQVEIYPLKHFIAMNFIMKEEKSDDPIIYSKNKNVESVLKTLANKLSISEIVNTKDIEKNLFIQKDIKGFEDNSFYIIKPNEYKCWHRAMAWYDVAEFKDAIQEAELNDLNKSIE